jgi:hypothetical protein
MRSRILLVAFGRLSEDTTLYPKLQRPPSHSGPRLLNLHGDGQPGRVGVFPIMLSSLIPCHCQSLTDSDKTYLIFLCRRSDVVEHFIRNRLVKDRRAQVSHNLLGPSPVHNTDVSLSILLILEILFKLYTVPKWENISSTRRIARTRSINGTRQVLRPCKRRTS